MRWIEIVARPLLVALALALSLSTLHAQEKKKERDVSQWNLGKAALALDGYDPVAYFEVGGGKPLKGSKTITATYEGVLYRFATEEHKTMFVKEPAKFEPQYGGWCAYAMAEGDKVEIDPESFVVREGKLYLFYKSFFNDTKAKWSKDPAKLVTSGDTKWAEFLAPPKPK